MLGYDPEDLIGRSVFDLLHPDDMQRASEAFAKLLQKPDAAIETEVRYKHKDGSWRHIQGAAKNLLHNPAVAGIVANYRDITERKRMENELLRLSDAVKMSNDSIVITDIAGIIIESNEATLKMLGMENRAELVGREALEIIAPEDQEMAAEQVTKALAGGGRISAGDHDVAKDGRKFLVEASISVMTDKNGEPTGYMAISRDITERKQMEEELRLLSDAVRMTSESVAIADLKGEILDINEAGLRMYGLYDRADLVGKDPFDIIVPEDQQKALESMAKILVEGSLKTVEYHILRKDGRKALIETSVSLIRGEKGEPKSIVAVARDITERRRMEEALRYSEEYFRALTENSSDGLLVLDGDGTVRYEGLSMERVLGFKAGEQIGNKAFQLVHPDDVPTVDKLLAELCRNSGISRQIELRNMHKGGSWRVLEVVGTNLLDNPAVKGIVINFRDVTERKRAEEALHESERRYRLLAENVRDTIWTADLNLRLTYISPSHTHMTGYSVEEALAQTLQEMMTPASVEIATKVIAEELAIEESGPGDLFRSRIIEVELNCKDGSTIPVEMKAAFLRGFVGHTVGVLGITRDIRKRRKAEEALRESEEKFRDLFENANDLIQSIDSEGQFLYVNKKWLETLGYSKEEVSKRNLLYTVKKNQISH